MAENFSVAVEQGQAQVTFNPHFHRVLVVGKLLAYSAGVVAEPAAHDFLTRGAGQIKLDVVTNPIPCPEGEGAGLELVLDELGDEGVVHVEGRGEMADQGLEELLAGAAGSPFDDRAEGGDVITPDRRQ